MPQNREPSSTPRPPWREAAAAGGACAVLGTLWMLLSDRMLTTLGLGPSAHTIKELAFILLGSLLLFFLVRRAARQRSVLVLGWKSSHKMFRALVEQSLTGIYIIQDGRFAYVNPRLAEILGRTPQEVVQCPAATDLFAPEERARVQENLRRRLSGEVRHLGYAVQMLHSSGRRLDVEVFGSRSAFDGRPAVIGVLLDQTERNRLLRQSQHSQKLEILGLLSAGIAHDFNNILTTIAGYSHILAASHPEGTQSHQDAQEILNCSEQATSLIRQLLVFSSTQPLQAIPLDLNEAIRKAEKMLQTAVGKRVRLELDLAADLGTVKAAPGQLEQVLMNLAINARDAMADGGRILISTGLEDRPSADAGAKSWAALRVRDEGCGMDPATLARLFEPFFTTKGPGKGTGLGLATVQRIAEQAGGRVEVDSAPGKGTTFSVFLPRA